MFSSLFAASVKVAGKALGGYFSCIAAVLNSTRSPQENFTEAFMSLAFAS